MRDLIIQGDPTAKTFTLTSPVTLPGGVTIPAGTELTGILAYLYPALDNDPTENNKANMLTDDTQALLGLPPDSDDFVGTVNLALQALYDLAARPSETTFQQLMTGRFI